jgi:ferredoxin
MKTELAVDPATCSGCGTCAELCPAHAIEIAARPEDGRKRAQAAPELADGCMRCGQCMAACPTDSIAVEGIPRQDLFPLTKEPLDPDAFQAMLESRRSVRVFKDEPVPPEALERIVSMVALAPMAYTPHKLDVTVVASPEAMRQAAPAMAEVYQGLVRAWRSRISRWFIRRELPPDELTALREHVMPTLPQRLEGMRTGRWDTITRGAPAMLLFHAAPEAGGSAADGRIAGTYALLAAHALGLGATMLDLVPPAVDHSPQVRAIFRIPEGHRVRAAVVVGVPRYRFHKGIRRRLPAVRWV